MTFDIISNRPECLELSRTTSLPAIIRNAGERTSRRFIEFFVSTIRNKNTRMAYAKALRQFCHWCDEHRVSLEYLEPIAVGTYIEQLVATHAAPSVKRACCPAVA
jgi:site-specific recombinase XerD